MKGEEILKKAENRYKALTWIVIIAILCIIAAVFSMNYRRKNNVPDPIDLSQNYGVGVEENKYAYLDVEMITEYIALYGDTENENNSSNEKYYFAFNNGCIYILNLDEKNFC